MGERMEQVTHLFFSFGMFLAGVAFVLERSLKIAILIEKFKKTWHVLCKALAGVAFGLERFLRSHLARYRRARGRRSCGPQTRTLITAQAG
jgi:hypothetical protein